MDVDTWHVWPATVCVGSVGVMRTRGTCASYCVGSVGVMRTRGTCDPRLIRLQGCGGRGVAAEGEKVIYYRK